MNGLERGSRVARVPLFALLAFAALASPVFAQKADRPIVRAGDRWQFVAYRAPFGKAIESLRG